jgi:hypothetical protein
MQRNGIELYCIVECMPYGYHVDETGRLAVNLGLKAFQDKMQRAYDYIKHQLIAPRE